MCCRTRLVYEVTTNNYEVRGSGGSKLGRSAATATATTLVQYSFFSRYVSYYRICRTVLVRAWTLDAWFPGRAFFLTISHCFATNDDSRFVTSYVPGYACGILKMIQLSGFLLSSATLPLAYVMYAHISRNMWVLVETVQMLSSWIGRICYGPGVSRRCDAFPQ
ncbi:hypothetical protein L227DRAFT_347558 [Lentinus tigrinus ALCF2SS1-6]|uniref:Uncharacterized protein n=1 Tax=Lentinus tigrinus ALCF2SS1-6 TaxID=1328759 RepID=A0A5C2RSA5_9APHY|nr:hypothetical protein L227DRAFT_347558 [Lentinus tigrinus ALCF2SS1-6]